jgi:phosphoglycerate dehydrogenase-like enzyme
MPRASLAFALAVALLAAPPAHGDPGPSAASMPAASMPAEEIGSTRNARVAFPIPPGTPAAARPRLTFLAADLSAAELAALAAVAPNVRVVAGLDEAGALAHAAEADGVDARLVTPAFLARAGKLVWVQARSAGVDHLLPIAGLAANDRIVLTNYRAVHGPAIAEHALAMLLTQSRNLGFYAEAQRAGRWRRDDPPHRSFALEGHTLLVVGIGGIGSEIAARAHAFGMRVLATRRSDAPAPPFVERVGKPDQLLQLLPEADVVAVAVPLTPETERMFGDRAFAAMKPGAFFINVARGRIVDTDALVRALRSGRLGGAGLDVTDPEPLPPDHPLWKFPNVIITPHVASDAELTRERGQALLRENLRRFGAGEPLLNVVDKRAGY